MGWLRQALTELYIREHGAECYAETATRRYAEGWVKGYAKSWGLGSIETGVTALSTPQTANPS